MSSLWSCDCDHKVATHIKLIKNSIVEEMSDKYVEIEKELWTIARIL